MDSEMGELSRKCLCFRCFFHREGQREKIQISGGCIVPWPPPALAVLGALVNLSGVLQYLAVFLELHLLPFFLGIHSFFFFL